MLTYTVTLIPGVQYSDSAISYITWSWDPHTLLTQEFFVPRKRTPLLFRNRFCWLWRRELKVARSGPEKVELEAQKDLSMEDARHQEEAQHGRSCSAAEETCAQTNPTLRHQPVDVMSSGQPLTMPTTPTFSTQLHC